MSCRAGGRIPGREEGGRVETEVLLKDKFNLTSNTKALLQTVPFTLLLLESSLCSCLRQNDDK